MYIKTMQLIFYLPTFSTPCMDYLLYLMFRYDFDVTESLKNLEELNTARIRLRLGVFRSPETSRHRHSWLGQGHTQANHDSDP